MFVQVFLVILYSIKELCKKSDCAAHTNTYLCFTVNGVNDTLPEKVPADQVELQCQLEPTLPIAIDEKTYEWSKDGAALEEGDKYSMYPNGSLFIQNAGKFLAVC